LLVALSMKNIKKILQILIADNGHRLPPFVGITHTGSTGVISARTAGTPDARSVSGRRATVKHRNQMSVLGPIASFWLCADDFRSTPMNRHSQCPPACLKGVNTGSRTRSRADYLGVAESNLVRRIENGLVEPFSAHLPSQNRCQRVTLKKEPYSSTTSEGISGWRKVQTMLTPQS
jgi:hypothetical protein